jgi:hypothetical protein
MRSSPTGESENAIEDPERGLAPFSLVRPDSRSDYKENEQHGKGHPADGEGAAPEPRSGMLADGGVQARRRS